jgi:formylglycine-generating enzyme required for sulfatase activity
VVKVADLFVGKYEVTVDWYFRFVSEQGNPGEQYLVLNEFARIVQNDGELAIRRGCGSMAANTVTWYGAVQFCRWLSAKTGDHYRLPYEAEWEWAAKGPEGRKYPWGDTLLPDRANWGMDWSLEIPWRDHPVGSYPKGATPEGLNDMVGSVWEWCMDWHDTPESALENWFIGGRSKVLKGGMVNRRGQEITTTTTRMPGPPPKPMEGGIWGFRVVRELEGACRCPDNEEIKAVVNELLR